MELDSIYGKDKWVLDHLDKAIEEATKICESFAPYEEEEETVRRLKSNEAEDFFVYMLGFYFQFIKMILMMSRSIIVISFYL